jgi:hypothetical protein
MLSVFKVSDWYPTYVTSVSYPGGGYGQKTNMCIDGYYLYVASGADWVSIINIVLLPSIYKSIRHGHQRFQAIEFAILFVPVF